MKKERKQFSDIMFLSIQMSVLIAFAQGSGFIARIVFRLILTPNQYGVFAYFINIFQFFVILNGFSVHVPIIAALSRDHDDEDLYKKMESQMFSTSILTGLILSIVFYIWTGWITQEWCIAFFFALMITLYSSSQVVHCMPRGRDKYKPASISYLLVGLSRLVFILPLFILPFMFVDALTLETSVLIYVLPVLGWWLSYLYFKGRPRFTCPDLSFIVPVYKDAAISYLYPLSLGVPLILGLIILQIFHGFDATGEFDIAYIPYSALTAILSGISFVTISKARKLGSFQRVIRKVVRSVMPALLALSIVITVGAIIGEDLAMNILVIFGFSPIIYWPAIILVVVGVPTGVVLSIITAYFQGRGIIRAVGIIDILCVILLLPVQVYLGVAYSIIGVALSISLVNTVLIIALLAYGVRTRIDVTSPRS